MFNNLVNRHDLTGVIEKIKEGRLRRVFSKLFSSSRGKVKKTWEKVERPPTEWWNIPEVRQHWNQKITGDERVDYYQYIGRKYLAKAEPLKGLSVACGTGQKELKWCETGNFAHIDAYDLSPTRVEKAKQSAKEKGFDGIIHYQVADVFKLDIPDNYYDLIVADQALHHFSPLEDILGQMNRFLKEDGIFIVNEFAGPTRFQWTKRQLEIANGLLTVLPERYRVFWDGKTVKTRIIRRSRLRMYLNDPSEAVESAQIAPLVKKIFNVIEFREYGGTILHLVLAGISHHFIGDDPQAKKLLQLCFGIEDYLLESGELPSDFIFAICKKKRGI